MSPPSRYFIAAFLAVSLLVIPLVPHSSPGHVAVSGIRFWTNEEYTRRFLAEARLATQLSHPNIVAAYDAAWVPYTTRIQEAHDKDGVMKPFCWNDEAKAAAHVSSEPQPGNSHCVQRLNH